MGRHIFEIRVLFVGWPNSECSRYNHGRPQGGGKTSICTPGNLD